MTVVCDRGLVNLQHRGALIATHARRRPVEKEHAAAHRKPRDPKRPATASAVAVTRKVDSSGTVSFAGTNYGVGSKYQPLFPFLLISTKPSSGFPSGFPLTGGIPVIAPPNTGDAGLMALLDQ